MKKLLLVLTAACLAGCGDSDANKPKDATTFFKPYVEKVSSAWSTLDASKPAMFYAKDAKLTFFDVSPLKYKGWQEYQDGATKVFANWKSLQITISPDFHATQAGNIAWATYTADLVIQPKTGDEMKLEARGTDILEKRGEEWLIIHEHFSLPMADQPPPAKATKAKATTHHKAKGRRR